MESSTYTTYVQSSYGTRNTTPVTTVTQSTQQQHQHFSRRRADHYDLFLLIQDMLRTDATAILEFPIDDWGRDDASDFGIGAGGFSSVSRRFAKTRWGERSVMAYKRIRPVFDYDGRIDDAAALEQFVTELKVLSVAEVRFHPNINRLRGVAFETQSYRPDGRLFPVLLSDPSSLGNLLDFIRDPVRMVDGPYWEFCEDVARGLHVLHKNSFIHGDVKCENVLVFPSASPERRKFVAKLTDFGCSMALDALGPNASTRLRGASPPYDAPESDAMIQREFLPATDVYSYGLLVWRVAIDGADPFNPRWDRSSQGESATDCILERIRENKRDETTLSIALSRIYDTDLALEPDTADGLGEVLTIALSSDPAERDLGRILNRRRFGLTAANGRFLREFMTDELGSMRELAHETFGLAVWNKVPPQAHHFYHIIHRFGSIDADFRGFGLRRIPPSAESLRLSQGIAPFMDALAAACAGAIVVAARYGNRGDADRLVESIQTGVEKFRQTCSSMAELFKSAAGSRLAAPRESLEKSSYDHTRGLYDNPGGLAATDTVIMMHENATQPSPGYEPSSSLDFYLLSTCRVPATLQEQLWKDISRRATLEEPHGRVAAMEQAICYGNGFGTKQSHIQCLSIMKWQCDMGYHPAQDALLPIHEALGFPIPEDIAAAEWYKRKRECSFQPSSETAVGDQLARATAESLNHLCIADACDKDDPVLIAACRAGNLSVLHAVVEDAAECSARNSLGESVLHWLWKLDPVLIESILPRLIRGGADINAVAYENPSSAPHIPFPLVPGTALHRAVAQGNKAAVSALLRHGGAVDQEVGPVFFHHGQSRRMDPVQLACTWHDADALELLLDAKPLYPVNADETGRLSLLYFAIQCQNTVARMARHGSNYYFAMMATVDLLIGRGCTAKVDWEGLTALQLAVEAQSFDVLEYIVTAGILVRDINELVGGKSALHRSIASGDRDKFELLIGHGANVLQPPTHNSLDFAVRIAPGNDYFVRRILEVGGSEITERDKNRALSSAVLGSQWALADYLLGVGASINGLSRMESSGSLPQSTVFGDILGCDKPSAILQALDVLIPLAEKHGQRPGFIVTPSFHQSALHVAVGALYVHQKSEAARIYSVLLNMFPQKHHLEARDMKGWTPLLTAICHRNAVAVQALIDAGADVNAMGLIEGCPAGPSTKDLVFAQIFARGAFYRLDIHIRDEGDRALERILEIYREDPRARIAKRSTTLRAAQRLSAPARDKRVMDFVEVLSLLPDQLSHEGHMLPQNFVEATAVGDGKQWVEQFDPDPREIARIVQWTGIESVRMLRYSGRQRLELLGLWDDYADG
ncbi:hypothetical protein BJX61DRAFT_542690 [Aspergillus egyptiacus]|nr:hypothetical protein BJX61DRAFT_542690 [Aspergillus egyptiacus]